jgi:hypothetical protein
MYIIQAALRLTARWPTTRWLLPSLIAGIACFVFGSALSMNYYRLSIDQAYMVESLDTTLRYGLPLTQLTKTAIDAIRNILSVAPETVCAMPLPADTGPMMNIFEWHSFPILYLLAPFRLLFSGNTVVSALGAITFVGMIAVVYLAARQYQVPFFAAVALAFLVSAHPAWSLSAFGQYYPDRLFMVFGLLYIVAIIAHFENGPVATWKLVTLATLATMCTERAGIMVCGFTLGSLILYRGMNFRTTDKMLLAIALVAGAYVLGYMRFVQANEHYGGFTSGAWSQITALVHGGIDPHLTKFLLVNSIGLAGLALFHWRLALFAAGAMLPNILGSIGGAEKTGWSIHYHTLYFTFLVAAALYGLVYFHRRFQSRLASNAASGFMLASAATLVLLDPYQLRPAFSLSWTNIGNYAPIRAISLIANTAASQSERNLVAMVRSAGANVPAGSSVSTVEGMVPALYDAAAKRTIYYYPLGIDSVDYVVLPYDTKPDGAITSSGAVSFKGAEAARKIDSCMGERLARQGFKVRTLVPYAPGGTWGYVVLGRK